jgi:acetylglutamate kinase
MISVRPHSDAELGLVGEVTRVDARLPLLLAAQGMVPLIAPIAVDAEGTLRNVNADAVCGAVAGAIGAKLAVFLTDVPGVRDETGGVAPRLTRDEVGSLISGGTVSGGMIPKVTAGLAALDYGAAMVCIADGRDAETLSFLLTGDSPTGTVLSDLPFQQSNLSR